MQTKRFPNLANLKVAVHADGTLAFDHRIVHASGLIHGGKVAVMFDEANQRVAIRQVPEWMGGIRLVGRIDGTLVAEKALDYLFEEFQPLRETKTYEAHWDIARSLIIVRMSLRRKRKAAEGRSR